MITFWTRLWTNYLTTRFVQTKKLSCYQRTLVTLIKVSNKLYWWRFISKWRLSRKCQSWALDLLYHERHDTLWNLKLKQSPINLSHFASRVQIFKREIACSNWNCRTFEISAYSRHRHGSLKFWLECHTTLSIYILIYYISKKSHHTR